MTEGRTAARAKTITWAAAAIGLLAIIVLLVVLLASSGPAPRHLYVDCSRPAGGSGTVASPWNNLAPANRADLTPGSSLLLRRGTTCHGFLAPRGSGDSEHPITIGAYGSGPVPRIVTDGAGPDSVKLADESFVVVQDLEVTNRGDYTQIRRGIHLLANRAGSLHDITVRRIHVEDIGGMDTNGLGGSGGIQVDSPTRNITIEANQIGNVNRSGIWIAGTGRHPRPPASKPWPSATTGVVIRGNTVSLVGGDGIVPTGTRGAIVADNVVCCGNLHGRSRVQFDAGIWTFDANATLIEGNVVYGMANRRSDGTGYDVDYDQDGTIVQDNYGYRNAGGLTLLCTDTEARHADVRFNLSVDEYPFSTASCPPSGTAGPGTLSGIRVYNNTFVTRTSKIWYAHDRAISTLPNAGSFQFVNNIVVATRKQSTPFPCGAYCSHNLFWGLPPAGTSAISADPRFAGIALATTAQTPRLSLGNPFRLRTGSPALEAGAPLPGPAETDYFGRPVPSPPALGFAQP